MNALYLTFRNLMLRPLSSLLHVLLIALGTGLVSLLITAGHWLDQQVVRNMGGVDMVIGAKGAPMQLILSTLLHADNPTGNIPLEEAQRWQRHPMVAASVPLSLGDQYRGYRIVGCTPDYATWYGAELARGVLFDSPFEACAGASAARILGLSPGDTLVAAHGLSGGSSDHHAEPYTLTGIFSPTGTALDQLLLTSLESVWLAHGEEHGEETHDHHAPADTAASDTREITALLLRFRNPMGTLMLGRLVNEETRLQAAVPAFEMDKLRQRAGLGTDVLRALGWALIALAGLSIVAALYQALRERRYELALMRAMGAPAWRLAGLLTAEGLLLSLSGLLGGLVLSRLGLLALQRSAMAAWKVDTALLGWQPAETWLALGVLGLGLLAGLLPALNLMRMQVAEVLSGWR